MIAVIHLRDSSFVGGPEKQILGQCARLDRSRFEPIVVSFARTKPNALTQAASELDLRADSLPDGKLAVASAVGRLRAIARGAGDCVVVASGFKADMTVALAGRRIPWIAWFHGHTGASPRVRLYEALDLIAVRRAEAVIAVCERAGSDLRRTGLREVRTIPNAVDAERIAAQGTRRSARAELGIEDGELVVGTVSRLSPEKGIGYFIESAPMILRKHPSARFVVIGDGPLGAELRRHAQRLGLSDRLGFAGHRPEAALLVKAMDVFVLPSIRENLPVALLEAMACGVSVVATDVGGVREVLAGTGVQPVSPRSAQAIAEAVTALLDAPQLRAIRGQVLCARAGRYSFDRQARLMETVIEQAWHGNVKQRWCRSSQYLRKPRVR